MPPVTVAPAREPTIEVTPEELEFSTAIRPPRFVLVRTAWFFGVFVGSATIRWTYARLSRGKAWLASEWKRAAARAKTVTSG